MPRLKSLAIYQIDSTSGGIFSYEVVGYSVQVGMKSCQPFVLGKYCREAWELVARKLNKESIRWHIIQVPVEVVSLCVHGILRKGVPLAPQPRPPGRDKRAKQG